MSDKYVDEIMESVNENVTGEGEPCEVNERNIRKAIQQQIRKAQWDGIRSFIDYSCKVGGHDRVTMKAMFGGYMDYHDIDIN